MSYTPSIEQFTMVSRRGRGCGRSHNRDFGGCGSFGGWHGSHGDRQTSGDKKPRQCKHCGRNNHMSEKCWEKFGHLGWAQPDDVNNPARGDIAHVHTLSAPPSGSSNFPTIILSQEEYDSVCQFELYKNSHSATHASSSDMNANIVSPQKP